MLTRNEDIDKKLREMGHKIAAARRLRNISQSDLGDICEMDKATISRIETGLPNITILTLFKIAMALQVEAAAFF